ncbi:putative phosphoenolpyruvate carboxylase [Rosa chinensis]|uniref:Putative phosphoenolpyruvate carboxylase n=1 Tax=Rosa chinensis TaxID=74649 RepID=A0A2P6S159_ROSCH|nr:putative phosphoenolpyruvate carboxylase [Rosa chinensis]
MDKHDLVVTKNVSLLSRWMTIDLYIREVDSLKFELSMNWCSNSLSKLAQEILEHSMTYCSYFQ